MPGERRRFARHALHQVAVADDGPAAVIDWRVACAVVARRQMRLGDRHADRIRQALAERAGRDFDALGVAALGMAGCLAAPLAEAAQIVQRQLIAGQVQQAIEQRRAVPGREHEAVAIGPLRVRGVVLEMARPQRISHRRGAERQAGMAALGLLHHVHRQEAKRVDALLIESGRHEGSFEGGGRHAVRRARRARVPPGLLPNARRTRPTALAALGRWRAERKTGYRFALLRRPRKDKKCSSE